MSKIGVDVTLPQGLLKSIESLTDNLDSTIKATLQAGAKVMNRAVGDKMGDVIGKGLKYPARSTGQLRGALGISPAKSRRDGAWDIKVGFSPARRNGKATNGLVGAVLERGKKGQAPKPYFAPARQSASGEAVSAMQKAFYSKISKL